MIDGMVEKLLKGRKSAARSDLYSSLAHRAGENNCLSTPPLVFAARGGTDLPLLKGLNICYVEVLIGLL